MATSNDKVNNKSPAKKMRPMKIVMRKNFKSGSMYLENGDLVAEVLCEDKVDIAWLADAIRNGIAGVQIVSKIVGEVK